MSGPREENPYEPPQTDTFGSPPEPQTEPRSQQELRELYVRQQQMLLVYLLQFAYPAVFSLTGTPMFAGRLLLALALMTLVIAGVIFCVLAIYRLAQPLLGTGTALICAGLLLVPYLGLVATFAVNRSAIVELRRHGIEVGLFGSNYEDI